MAQRVDFQTALETFMEETSGTKNVYFSPPEGFKLKYPCIVYHRYNGQTTYSGNMPYTFVHGYQVTLITKDIDTEILDKLIMRFPMSRYERHFVSDNLSHDSIIIYY